jgi:hypothetical protein
VERDVIYFAADADRVIVFGVNAVTEPLSPRWCAFTTSSVDSYTL